MLSIVGTGGGGGGGGGGGDTNPLTTVATVTLSPTSADLSTDDVTSQQFSATAKDAAGATITDATFSWASSDLSIATVDSSGLAQAQAVGTTTITATSGGIASSGATVTVTTMGILLGATNYPGTYATAVDVTYVNESAQGVTVRAIPGQVMVFFTNATSESDAVQEIEGNGGTVISRIPELDYYLADAGAGNESQFITQMFTVPNVTHAFPNVAVSLRAPVEINPDYFTTTKPVPLNVPTGVLILDGGFSPGSHGEYVRDTVTLNGGTVGGLVNLLCSGCPTNESHAHHIGMIVAAAAQGNSIYNPGESLILNISYGPELGFTETGDFILAEDVTAAEVTQKQNENEVFVGGILEQMSRIDADIRDDLAVTFAMGNSHVDLTQMMANLRTDPDWAEVLSENFLMVRTDQAFSNYSAGNDTDVVTSNNAEAADGTSQAAPAVAAILQTTIANTGVTLAQAIQAGKTDDDTNNVITSDGTETEATNLTDMGSTITGTWSGTYSSTGLGGGGCTYNSGGNMDMTLTAGSSSFSGPSPITGIQLRFIPGCALAGSASSTGSVTGSYTSTTLTGSGSYPVAESGGTFMLTWTATITGTTMNGTFTGEDTGSFTLTKQ